MDSQTELSRLVAARVEDENAVRTKLSAFAEALYSAIERLLPELEQAGLKVTSRRAEVEESLRLELEEQDLHDKILFLTQHVVAYVLDRPGAVGALYVFVVPEGMGNGVPVERFLVSKTGVVTCEGWLAPLETDEAETIARRLIETVWVRARMYWHPLDAIGPMPTSDLEMPRLRGQIGFRPRTAVLPSAGVRGSREHRG